MSAQPASAHSECTEVTSNFDPFPVLGEACVNSSHWQIRVRDTWEDGRGVFVDFVVRDVSDQIYRLRDSDGAGSEWVRWDLLSPVTRFRVCVRDLACSAPASPLTGWTAA
jgi:hypothetical protein